MNPIKQEMAQLLHELAPEVFEFEDQSHLHAGHAGAREGGHFAILLVSQTFDGMNRVARQRYVQQLLAPLFQSKKIHALSIVAKSLTEYFH
ncbi:BolA family protein [Neisseriaceae bacterium B1]